jgi:hypothetical protein
MQEKNKNQESIAFLKRGNTDHEFGSAKIFYRSNVTRLVLTSSLCLFTTQDNDFYINTITIVSWRPSGFEASAIKLASSPVTLK